MITNLSNQTSAPQLSSIVGTNVRAATPPFLAPTCDPSPSLHATAPAPERNPQQVPLRMRRPAPLFPESPGAPLRGSKCPPGIALAVRLLPFRRPRAAKLAKYAHPFPWLPPIPAFETRWPPEPRAPGAPCWRNGLVPQSLLGRSLSNTAHTIRKTPAQNRRRRCLPPFAPASRRPNS